MVYVICRSEYSTNLTIKETPATVTTVNRRRRLFSSDQEDLDPVPIHAFLSDTKSGDGGDGGGDGGDKGDDSDNGDVIFICPIRRDEAKSIEVIDLCSSSDESTVFS